MILSDTTLRQLLPQLIAPPFQDESLVNAASVDIRVGYTLLQEWPGETAYVALANFRDRTVNDPHWIAPGGFVLVATLEAITIPNGYVAELKLKSSRAREGWNHTLAFHVDPGWHGVLTMELKNLRQQRSLALYPGLRMGQLVISTLDHAAAQPYRGKYQGATAVEGSREASPLSGGEVQRDMRAAVEAGTAQDKGTAKAQC